MHYFKRNEQKICFFCHSKSVKKNGKVGSIQLYKCKDCGKQFRGVKRLYIAQLSDDYVFGCQSVNRLATKYGVSSSTIRRKLDAMRSTRIVSSDKRVVVLMDARYLTSKPELEASKELLATAKFMRKTDKEGFVGVFEEWAVRWAEFLKERIIDCKSDKIRYIHRKLRSAYLSIKRNMSYLWTWYDNPASVGIPNTNNGLEGKFTDLKTKLRNHNGLSIKHRMIFIDAYFKGTYK